MNDLERRALLGDAEAQRECTEKGIVLPCPFCGNEPITEDNRVFCGACGLAYEELDAGLSLRAWNTRPAPPIGRCGECKHSTNPAALTMIYGEPGTLTCHHGPCNRRNVNENDFCSYFEPKEEK